ncbi:MAG: metallophosphoesterase family protein [Clostridia bacterium]|nr:metallophosphoesterase family protein [Clostridia bacterium]
MLHFNNGTFKIMQIADIQEDYPVNPDTIKLIELALDKEKPDLVVLTGDQVQAYHSCYKTDAENKVRAVINAFITPMEERNIPFCMTFGNHDDDGSVTKDTQIKIYSSYSGCRFGIPRCDEDKGTYSLQIFDSAKEKEIFNLYLIDSNKKEPDGAYSPVKKEQIEWFRKERERLKKKTGAYLPSFVFQHIPVPEYYDTLIKCPKKEKGSVEAFKSRNNTFWKLDSKTIAEGGFMYESPAVPEINNGEFDALKEKGDVLGIFVGHDHINSFITRKDGIDLGYSQGAGFSTYGAGDKRGVRVYILDEKDIRNYKSYTVTMGELCDYKPSKPVKEFVFSHMPSSVDEALSKARKLGVVIGITAAACIFGKKLLK